MDDLISRQEAIDALIKIQHQQNNGDGTMTIQLLTDERIRRTLNALPSAERKGKWIHDPDPDAGLGWYTCSECGHNDYEDPDFCPNCGARMLIGEEDE